MKTLQEFLELQHELQVEGFGKDPMAYETEDAIQFIHWNVTALVDELHEMLAEIGWKPWASSRHINGGPAMKEMVDAWHFFMNILMALAPAYGIENDLGDLAETFEGLYLAKRNVNAQRQHEGYDGVSSKCTICRRELSEAHVAYCGAPVHCPLEVTDVNG